MSLRASNMSLGDGGVPSPTVSREQVLAAAAAAASRGNSPTIATSPTAAAMVAAAAVPGPATPPLPAPGGGTGGGAARASPSYVSVAVEPSTSGDNVNQPYFSPTSSPTLGMGTAQGPPLPTSPMPVFAEGAKETRRKKRRDRKSREEVTVSPTSTQDNTAGAGTTVGDQATADHTEVTPVTKIKGQIATLGGGDQAAAAMASPVEWLRGCTFGLKGGPGDPRARALPRL